MSSDMAAKGIYAFLSTLHKFLEGYPESEFWVYSNRKESGSLLIKNMGNDKKILFKPWDTEHLIGSNKLQNFILHNPTFKNHPISNFIFLGRVFRTNAKNFAKLNNAATLLSVDLPHREARLFGSKNLDSNLLNCLIQFLDSMKFKTVYDFQGSLTHGGFSKKKGQLSSIEERSEAPSVFLSYSWDNEAHKLWVLKLAADLIKNGINVLIDEWDIEKYSNDLNLFMESGIRDSTYVILVCTPEYAKKANGRKGGVGVESTIITGEFYDRAKEEKFIPIVRRSTSKRLPDSLPSYLKSKMAIDFQDDSTYSSKLEDLLRKIFKVPKYQRPELGKKPNLRSEAI
jgi:hypothetical protein